MPFIQAAKTALQCEEARESRSHGRYMAARSRPLRKIMRGDNPPRWSIQRCTSVGYMEYSVCVASGSAILRPLEAGFQAAWNPSLAREVTQILVMRNRAESDGAGRETNTVYDYHLA